MLNIAKTIFEKKYKEAKLQLEDKIHTLIEQKLIEMKKAMNAEYINEVEYTESEDINEAPRIRIVRARVRGGKVQRRKKVSNVKGYTMRKKGSGPARLIRLTPTERRHRRLGQRRGKIKRRAKRSRIRQRMKRSLRKRHSIGLK